MNDLRQLAAASVFVLALSASSVAFGEDTGQYVDDAAITTKVKAALLADLHLKAAHISVATNQGVVELSGGVDTAEDESQAVKDANQITGVSAVKDRMAVKGKSTDDQSN